MLLEIEYSNKVSECFSDYNKLSKKIGAPLARMVKNRTNQLRAAESISDYLTLGLGRPHELKGEMKGTYSVGLSANFRLLFEENAGKITVKGVVDYHGDKINWLIP